MSNTYSYEPEIIGPSNHYKRYSINLYNQRNMIMKQVQYFKENNLFSCVF